MDANGRDPGYRNERGGVVHGAPDPASAHVFAFMRNTFGIVEIKGARERWIAPAALHTCSMGIDESSWTTNPDTLIGLRLSGSLVEDHGHCLIRTSGPGRDLTFKPRGAASRYLAPNRITFGQIFLPDALLDRASEEDNMRPVSGRLRDDISFVPERTLQSLAGRYLRRAFDRRLPPTSLEMEGRALLLVDWLLRLHGSPHTESPTLRGGLSPVHVQRVRRFIREHLAQDIGLDELAELTGLSSKHFARAFRQSMGVSPHRYLIWQRIEAAKHRLLVGRESLAEIALVCGFADQSHFTATFRRAEGVPPGTWRRQTMA